MPQKYIRKTTEKYSISDLNAAVKDIKTKGIPLLKAAKKHGVPRSTLRRHVSKVDLQQGRPCVLPRRLINKLLIDVVLYAKSAQDVKEAAYKMSLRSGVSMPPSWTKNERAGNDWWQKFAEKYLFVRHFLAANSNNPRPAIAINCGSCSDRFLRDMGFSFCAQCCDVICDDCAVTDSKVCCPNCEKMNESVF